MTTLQHAIGIFVVLLAGIGVLFVVKGSQESRLEESSPDTTGGNQDGHPEGHAEKRAARAGGVNNRAA